MRVVLVVGLVAVVAVVIAAIQSDAIVDWISDDQTPPASSSATNRAAEDKNGANQPETTTKPKASTGRSQAEKPARPSSKAKQKQTTAVSGQPSIRETMIESSKTTDQNAVAASDGDAGTDDGVKPPSFDVVRVNPKGDAVIAGRADPGAEVTVRDAGTVVGKTTADKRGEWVIVPEKPLASGARQLSLQETTTTGQIKDSKDVVVLLVPEQPRADGASGALAVLTPREGQGSRVLQAPAAPSTKADSEKDLSLDLSLGVIDYDEKGRVVLSGKAPPGSEVRAIVDDKTVGSARADKAGDWQISPDKPVVSGQHAIRIEQVSKSGAILAKLSVPFSRATVRPGTLAPGTIVVEPGNSLWRIARMTYGEGTKYTLIFAANSEQIGNPNVIFPGQIFVLPPNTASN